MISLKRKQSGFTIVELLIVIVVIGILAALVVTTFAGIQRKARNTERETDVKAIAGQLEAYFNNNNSYPTFAQLNDATWRDATDANGNKNTTLEAGATRDPRGANDNLCNTAGTANCYAYVPEPAGCDGTTTLCDGFTLSAVREGSGPAITKASLN